MNGTPAAHLSLAGTPAATPLGYLSWTFGQGARDPYYIMVIIYIFLPYFSNTVVGDPVQGQTLIGYLNATAGVILALTAPFLGAIADKNGRRKPWIAATVLVMSAGALALWYVRPAGAGLGIYPTLLLLLVISVAFAISEVFHNAMLPSITPINKVGFVSGLAFSLGNVGGLLLMLFVLFAFSLPGTVDWSFLPTQALFGIDQGAEEHNRIVGPIAGLWMLIFTLPVLLFTPDGKSSGTPMWRAAKTGVKDVLMTLRQLKHYSNIGIYLLGRMFFIDGMIGVMTFGGVYASGTFNWDTTALLIFGLVTSSSAMIGAYVGGKLDDRLGSIRTLQIAIAMSSLVLITLVSIQPDTILFFIHVGTAPVWNSPYFASAPELFYFATNQVFAMFFVTGLSSSRTLMARISPPAMITQFFGLFALSGTVTAFLAPLLVATVTTMFQSQRAGFASLVLLMLVGSALLLKVREEQSSVAPGH
ncbi:MAG: MFS transporter [Pseudomonadales bacterium]|nr:MFS transporter [Pseudomonadales bacterium]MDP4640934.1 MFS transporter [Pseudomonadales bacterium]MDP4911703.1 MFS transporter [Pseudomonadales bacterium]MDP5058049.1 MFS transporter [Pseudomonadales bacterium]